MSQTEWILSIACMVLTMWIAVLTFAFIKLREILTEHAGFLTEDDERIDKLRKTVVTIRGDVQAVTRNVTQRPAVPPPVPRTEPMQRVGKHAAPGI